MGKPIKAVILYKNDLVLDNLQSESLDVVGYKYSEAVYDRQGNVLKECKYTVAGEVEEKTENRYDDEGRLIEEILFINDEEIAEHKTFERDARGVILKEYRHYLDDTKDTIHYHYNEEGHLIRKQTMNPDDEPEGAEVFTYENGKLKHYELLDADDSLISEKEFIYDDSGKVTETVEHYPGDFQRHRIVEEFDENGKRIKTLRYNGKEQLVEKMTYEWDKQDRTSGILDETPYGNTTTHFSYDRNNNVILQEDHNQSGELLSKIERKYNEDNQITESQVFIDGQGRGMSQDYNIRYEYEYYDEV
jgi:phage anti-repressor protein